MKKLLPHIGLLFLLLLPLLGRSQETRITGRVVDAVTKEPIPSTSVSLVNAGIGALTDEFGRFQLVVSKPFKNDSVRIVNLAYEKYFVAFNTDNANELVVEIRRRNVKTIEKRDTTFVCHLISQNPERNLEAELLSGIPGMQYAFFIPNQPKTHFGKLRTVFFYVGDQGFPIKSFRIRIYKADGAYYSPKTDLLDERLIIKPSKVNQWYTCDLSRYKIDVPEEGYFVALEYVKPDNTMPQSILENYAPLKPVMRPTNKARKSIVWMYNPNSKWNFCSKTAHLHRFNAMIKVEVDSVN